MKRGARRIILFFLLTNTLITFGITLVVNEESHQRFDRLRQNGLRSALAELPAETTPEG